MSSHDRSDTDALFRRVHGEVIDSFDEELEMEIDDERLAKLLTDAGATRTARPSTGSATSTSCSACRASS